MNDLERCRPWIEAALKRSNGGYDYNDIVDGISSGLMQFWPAPMGCAITQIVELPRRRVLHVLLAGGDMAQLFDMIESAAAWGRAQDCTAMTMTGRKGWLRALKGWQLAAIEMERAI